MLKTAESRVMHKSDAGGVLLGIRIEAAVRRTYPDLRTRFGATVVVQRQIGASRTHAFYLGMTHSPEWGPVVTIGIAGIDIETTRDTVSVPPPVSPDDALAMLRRLRGFPLLLGSR